VYDSSTSLYRISTSILINLFKCITVLEYILIKAMVFARFLGDIERSPHARH